MKETLILILFFFLSLSLFLDIVTNVADVYHQEKSNNLEYILDVTIGYENGQPLDLPTIVSGIRDPCQTFFFYRLYHSSEVSLN